ncbi:2-polyprenyl-3-methyl-5-hydroxy-6-metoxy-1,4-benzoquinol methylase [Methanofollis sp. W23]|nr:2-polyprenyl-3-methyl-5-hydroxy-6-metoxy-1,4-benzoquinol methylase [Methanofollis sp. W23]
MMPDMDVHRHTEDELRLKTVSKYCSGRILDLGCNKGELKQYLDKNRTNYIGLDMKGDGCDIQGNLYNLPFKNQSFDTVTLFEVLEHLENPLAALKEAARVSRSTIVISVPNPYSIIELATLIIRNRNTNAPYHVNLFGENEIKQLSRRSSLKIEKIERFNIVIPTYKNKHLIIPIKSRFGHWNIYVLSHDISNQEPPICI